MLQPSTCLCKVRLRSQNNNATTAIVVTTVHDTKLGTYTYTCSQKYSYHHDIVNLVSRSGRLLSINVLPMNVQHTKRPKSNASMALEKGTKLTSFL